jgi:hypothetical protein
MKIEVRVEKIISALLTHGIKREMANFGVSVTPHDLLVNLRTAITAEIEAALAEERERIIKTVKTRIIPSTFGADMAIYSRQDINRRLEDIIEEINNPEAKCSTP